MIVYKTEKLLTRKNCYLVFHLVTFFMSMRTSFILDFYWLLTGFDSNLAGSGWLWVILGWLWLNSLIHRLVILASKATADV